MKVEAKNLIQAAGRRHGNTDLLADEFVCGAEKAGVKVEKVYVADKNIRGCLAVWDAAEIPACATYYYNKE